jgi:hypothetical protein
MNARVHLEFIVPRRELVVIDGRELTIEPLRVGELPRLIAIVEPLMDGVLALPDETDVALLLDLVTRQGDRVLDALAIAARVEREWVAALHADRLVALLGLVVEVNADFFRRAMPGMASVGARLRSAVTPAAPTSPGPTPSSS